jgi:hypothetical protein
LEMPATTSELKRNFLELASARKGHGSGSKAPNGHCTLHVTLFKKEGIYLLIYETSNAFPLFGVANVTRRSVVQRVGRSQVFTCRIYG